MAFLQCDFHSESLGLAISMNVILPQTTSNQIGMQGEKKSRTPVLYLLHGLSDDHTIWMRRTSIERYAAPLGLAVVMPGVARSYYSDMEAGLKYWTFISEELPKTVNSFFNVSERREDTFVAGLSMGGYGAFKLALNCPERFAAAASLSGALDPAALFERWPDRTAEFSWMFGSADKIKNSRNDLKFTLKELMEKNRNAVPALYQWCGSEDFLYKDNIEFRDYAKSLNAPLLYKESAGDHNWACWDTMIQDVLKWLPIKS